MHTSRSKRVAAILSLGFLFILIPILATGQDTRKPYQELERLVALSSDHAAYDSDDFSASELAGTAVSPFCKSFTFLCHVRCLQRGDAKDPKRTNAPSTFQDQTGGSIKGETNRCSHVPDTNMNRVLCLCNNGVDLTAEVDYALEGVVDIQAAGGDGVGTGEAGKIREVVYGATKTQTKVVTVTEMVTTTITSFAPAPPPTIITETVTVIVKATGVNPVVKSVQTQPPTAANSQLNDGESDKSDYGEAGNPEEQDEDDENSIPIHSFGVIRKGTHHDFAKVKTPQELKGKAQPAVKVAQMALDLRNSKAQAQFGTVAQELDETGDLAYDSDAYQDPYLEQELAGMVDIDELQAYADEAEVEAEGDQDDESSSVARDEVDEDEDDFNKEDGGDNPGDEEDVYDEEASQEEDEIDESNEEEEG
ncbi:hypothetical protein BGZ95_006236 [Linnemannia exigua]|uniref:Uncharacterized protein n=1 Tax=Linnemannia exigua TaxID=604196 RepID=A0AAD4DGK4_9FUNG|nr:hypothetical protein BGZ95_006236 [Linnemannia exigua]